MKARKLFSAVLLMIFPVVAGAQPEPADTAGLGQPVAAVADRTLELAVASGSAQGAGKLGGTLGNLDDAVGPGAALQTDVGYRSLPPIAEGPYGTIARSQHGDPLNSNPSVPGATAGISIQDAWHFRPNVSIEPWVSLGVDYRVTKEIAISPVIGGSLARYVSQDSPMSPGYTEIADKRINITGFVGLAGRFGLVGAGRARESVARYDVSQDAW